MEMYVIVCRWLIFLAPMRACCSLLGARGRQATHREWRQERAWISNLLREPPSHPGLSDFLLNEENKRIWNYFSHSSKISSCTYLNTTQLIHALKPPLSPRSCGLSQAQLKLSNREAEHSSKHRFHPLRCSLTILSGGAWRWESPEKVLMDCSVTEAANFLKHEP